MASYFDEHGVTTQPRNSNNRFSPNVNDFLNPTPQANDPQQLMNRAYEMLTVAAGLSNNHQHTAFIQGLLAELFEHKVERPPTSANFLRNLPTDISKKGSECAICTDAFEDKQTHAKLPCKHFFHIECITPWLKINNTCPVCRFELPTDDEEYERKKREKQKAQRNVQEEEEDYNPLYG